MKNFLTYAVKFFSLLSSSIMVLLLLILSWQVFSRYVLKNPSTVTEELSRLLLIVMASLGTTLTFLLHQQLGLDTLTHSAGTRFKKISEDFSDVIVMLLGLVLIVGGVSMISAKWSLEQTSPVLGFKQVYLYFLLPFCGFFIMISPFNRANVEDKN